MKNQASLQLGGPGPAPLVLQPINAGQISLGIDMSRIEAQRLPYRSLTSIRDGIRRMARIVPDNPAPVL
ncbi:hypothetical protein PAJ34TS1_13640 [Paenibacillus azoreducens]